MEIEETWINGMKVYAGGQVQFKYQGGEAINQFNSSAISMKDIEVEHAVGKMRVIEAIDGEIITGETSVWSGGSTPIVPDSKNDILKIVLKDRYNDSPASVAFIKGFGLKSGAFASSVAHDSHNIICVGANDNDIVAAVNRVAEMKGGLAVAICNTIDSLPLGIGGIMSNQSVEKVAAGYELLSARVKALGCKLSAPFMTLSFMALLVIPALKLSDKGLFDGKQFRFVPLFYD